MKVGILAIQGDYNLHKQALNKLNINNFYIKKSSELSNCSALIIPGGESTTMSLLMNKFSLFDKIFKFSLNKPIFGTCAGSILMSKSCNDSRVITLNCINVKASRNAWGPQIDSFSDKIKFSSTFKLNKKDTFLATFIRAPKFSQIGKDCSVLASYNDNPVLIRNKKHLVSSFHPEIGTDLIIYKYFLTMINE